MEQFSAGCLWWTPSWFHAMTFRKSNELPKFRFKLARGKPTRFQDAGSSILNAGSFWQRFPENRIAGLCADVSSALRDLTAFAGWLDGRPTIGRSQYSPEPANRYAWVRSGGVSDVGFQIIWTNFFSLFWLSWYPKTQVFKFVADGDTLQISN